MTKQELICGKCGAKDRVYDTGKYHPEENGIIQCDNCGAKRINGIWKKVCSKCNKEVDKLFDLFVPHNCKECSDRLHKEAKEKGDYCRICGALRIDCCC